MLSLVTSARYAARALCRQQGVVGLDALFRAMRAAVLTITSGEEDTLAEASAARTLERAPDALDVA